MLNSISTRQLETELPQSQNLLPSPPNLGCFFSFLRTAFHVAAEDAIPTTSTQHMIVQDRDRFLPFRQLAPSKHIILDDPSGPFSPARLKTQEGLFDALIFRLITQASPILIQEKQVCFGTPEKFRELTKGREQSDYCNPTATGQYNRFHNLLHIRKYWEHTANWSEVANNPEITLGSLLTWFTGHEGKVTRFYGMGKLVGWLLASDYAYAGLVKMPGAAEVGEIIFKIKAGGKDGLELLGFQVDTQESCAMAMETVWMMVQRCFTSDQINEMGLDPTTLEHALCKFKRMYVQCIANVS